MADWKDALIAKTEDTTPDMAADMLLVYDDSAGVLKKAKPSSIVGSVLNTLRTLFTPASALVPASLQFHEDTDNGTNKITVTAPSLIASDKTLTLPDATDTLVGKDTADTLTNKTLTAPVITSPVTSLTPAHSVDDTYSGTIIPGLNNSGGVTQWDAVYLNGSSQWVLADANGSGTYPARGLAIATVATANATSVLIVGTVRNDAWNWTPGGAIYLSGTPGGLTQTAPSTSGDKVQVVGYAVTADVAFFDFNSTYLTVT